MSSYGIGNAVGYRVGRIAGRVEIVARALRDGFNDGRSDVVFGPPPKPKTLADSVEALNRVAAMARSGKLGSTEQRAR